MNKTRKMLLKIQYAKCQAIACSIDIFQALLHIHFILLKASYWILKTLLPFSLHRAIAGSRNPLRWN